MTLSQELVAKISAYTAFLTDVLCSLSLCSVTSDDISCLLAFSQYWQISGQRRMRSEHFLVDSLTTTQHRLAEAPPKPMFLLGDVPHIALSPHSVNLSIFLVTTPYRYYAQRIVLFLVGSLIWSQLHKYSICETLLILPRLNVQPVFFQSPDSNTTP